MNYTSGKAAGGSGAHSHTTLWLVGGTAPVTISTVYDYAAFAPNIPESSYWVNSIGYDLCVTHTGKGGVTLGAERLSGEGIADGWQEIGTVGFNPQNEIALYNLYFNASDVYDRHPLDPDARRMAVEGSRARRVNTYIDPSTAHGGWSSLVMAVTYHAITTSVTRAITGYAGDGSGIEVNVYRDDTKELVYVATSEAGGDYTFVAYDNVEDLFAEAHEDATHVGRSSAFTAS